MDNVVLQMENIRKEFPGVLALNNVSLTVLKGEVHALMGENGAGKSTLIKILTGIYTKDAGTITFCGKEVDFQTAKQAQDGGISTIYQELNLIPQMSVAENMFLGRQPIKNGSIDWKQIYSETNKIMEDLGISVDIHLPLSRYSTAIQQMVAIARAVSLDAKLVIMDEPTSSLGENEVRTLFDIIRKIRDRGIAVIFISHRMDEIFEICDRVTILRDGCLVETDLISEIDKYKLITKMIGRDAGEVMQIRKQAKDDLDSQDIVFEAHNITKGVKVRGIDLTIKRGEVVGLAGLLGAGRTEFARAIFAADKMDAGEILIDGKKVKFRSSRDAVRSGIGFLSEDRKAEGITPHLTVRENMTLAILRKISSAGWISKKRN